MNEWLEFDWDRGARTGVPEAVFAQGKTLAQLEQIVAGALTRDTPLLLTRLDAEPARQLGIFASDASNGTYTLDYDLSSRTAWTKPHATRAELAGQVAVVAAGTADHRVAREAVRTMEFNGAASVPLIGDVGVAGLWRLLKHVDELRTYRVLIAAAGMEGALFSVLAGLVPGVVIAVPTSVGYGVSQGGQAALHCALASCAPGIVAVNIDNGFGAACAALKMLGSAPA